MSTGHHLFILVLLDFILVHLDFILVLPVFPVFILFDPSCSVLVLLGEQVLNQGCPQVAISLSFFFGFCWVLPFFLLLPDTFLSFLFLSGPHVTFQVPFGPF